MTKPLLAALLLATTSAANGAEGPTALASPAPPAAAPAPAPAPDPCDGLALLEDDAACGDSPLCGQRARVKLACSVRDALEQRYVFYSVKGRMLDAAGVRKGFDARAHLGACIGSERAIEREGDPLRFYDRMRRCVAGFEDGHLLLGAPVRLPQVALGVGLRLVGGKVHIANREKKLLSYLKTVSGVRDLDAILALGNEVLAIDGRPVGDWIEELAAFVPGSSAAARREGAGDALTRRDFAYPGGRTAALTILVKGTRRVVELPWWTSPDADSHVMTDGWVRRTGIATTELLTWRYDEAKDTWDRDGWTAQGVVRTEPIVPARDAARLREYLDENDRPALRLGEVVRRRDRAFCYLQILTFQTEEVAPRGDVRRPFGGVVEEFVRGCREKELDVVLDLRENGGGYLAHSNAILQALARPGEAARGGALLLRANTLNQLVYQQRVPTLGSAGARAVDDALEPRGVLKAIGAARRARNAFTAAFLDPVLRPSDGVGGYAGQVVALVSPACSSACERLAGMLQANGRATLVGGPTEGAGGSQQEARNLSARWTDPEGLLSLSIPNAAMGVQRAAAAEARREIGADQFFETLAFENRPVLPDRPYAPTLEDLTASNRGWLEQVDAVLFGSAPDASRADAHPAPDAAAISPHP
jgi:hypothetical protein